MSAALDSARREWEDAHRRLEAESRSGERYLGLVRQVDVITAELRRRVGQTYTLEQLAEAYAGAEHWSRDALVEAGPPRGWARTHALVEAAAFHVYARGALDYAP